MQHDAVDEALTELWMANTLCLTFLALNAIAFAACAWGVPVVARTLAAEGRPLGVATRAVLAVGSACRAHPALTLALWAGLSAGAIGAQMGWESRRGRIRLFALASCVPLAGTVAICVTALLA